LEFPKIFPAQLVEQRISGWQWSEAEAIYQAEAEMREQRWHQLLWLLYACSISTIITGDY